MPHTTADKRALPLPEEPGFSIQFDFCSPADNNPMFTPVMVQLEGQPVTGFYAHPFDFVDIRFFQHRIRSPRAMYLPVEFGNRIFALIIAVYELFYLLCLAVVANKESIGRVNHNEIVNSNQSYMFSGCLDKIIRGRKILRDPNIALTVMQLAVIQGFECTQVIPLGLESNNRYLF